MPFSISRLLLFLAMGGLISLSFLAIQVLERDVQAYRTSNEEAIHWSAAQVEVELTRFLLALNRYHSGDEEVDNTEVNRRFDLLWSRTGLFRSGSIGERLRRSDEGLGAIPLTIATLQQNEEAVLNLQRGDDPTYNLLMREFSDLQNPLRRLSVKVLDREQDRYAQVRRTLLDSSRMTFWVWAATLLIAALLVGVMFLEARRYTRTIRETAKLADQAQAANRAKSRFLTMMSHELRTPMNGVMGLMALAKQSGLSEKQLRLIEQAERSGTQMVGLLGDILDFSDLQNEKLALDVVPFQPKQLADAVSSVLSGLTARTAVKLEINCCRSLPAWVEGDFARLRQTIVHFCAYFTDTVGTRDVRLIFAHDDRDLVIEIDLEAKEADQPGWQPEAIFGRAGADYGEFASDAVGPTIARGFVDSMGGSVRLRRENVGRASLVIRVPAPEVLPEQDCIRVETHSDTTALLLNAAIDGTRWRVWTPAMQFSRVAAVLLEVGGGQEKQALLRLRAEHPSALIVAIGMTEDPASFDACESVPLPSVTLNALMDKCPIDSKAAAS
ncbi:MAG: sensor histidine kinase [Paracoccaceae bacterium]